MVYPAEARGVERNCSKTPLRTTLGWVTVNRLHLTRTSEFAVPRRAESRSKTS